MLAMMLSRIPIVRQKVPSNSKKTTNSTVGWGGLPTCSALDGLSKAERKEQGHSTGVIRLTFASSFMVSENLSLSDVKALAGHTEPEPWLKFLDVSVYVVVEFVPTTNSYQDGNVVAEDVYENMYHDVEREEADKYISRLRPHSMYTFAAKTRSAAWRKIPVAYLVCENDKAIPVAVQDALVEGARKEGAEVVVERVAASHSPYISQPKAVADFLLRAAGGL